MKLITAILSAGFAASAATVTGSVFDPSGAMVPGAQIRVMKLEGAQTWSGVSQQDGRFEVTALPDGLFEVQVLAPGFVPLRRSVRIAGPDDRPSVAAVLRVGEIQETVKVTAAGRAAQPGPQRVRVGGNIQPPKLLNQTKPEYPESAKRAGREGTAVLRAIIGTDGSVVNVTPMTGVDRELSEAAVAAVRSWKYQPALLNGEPVEVVSLVEVAFHLSE